MLHVINVPCVARDLQRLRPGHLSVRVRDSSGPSREIVKISICAFQSDNDDDDDDDDATT